MSKGPRRILTAKALVLSVLILAFAAIAIARRRQLDAAKTSQRRSAYPPHIRPGW